MPSLAWDPDGPNLLLQGDNLEHLAAIPDESIALAYLDPPFNTGRTQVRKTTSARSGADGSRGGFGGRLYDLTLEKLLSYDDNFSDYWAFLAPRLEETWRVLSRQGTLYLHLDWHEVHYAKVALDMIFGRENFLNEIIWAYDYGGKTKKRWPTKHDTILVYVKDPQNYVFNSEAIDREPYMAPGLVGAEKAARGKLPTDVWWHTIVSPTGQEKTGYATQKPLGILRRIIRASSNPGDWVLDPFSGSGTTAHAAAELGRRFVAIDALPDAHAIMTTRLAPYL
ncbi:MAG: site-specific DNA-methyltransferase [Actinobacteria bacterium]|nr:site-specific DNA-methyltransferase [Actinomycetota bacterium]